MEKTWSIKKSIIHIIYMDANMQNCSSTSTALFLQHEQMEFVSIYPLDGPIDLNNKHQSDNKQPL